jgi:YHS domain-containing protein
MTKDPVCGMDVYPKKNPIQSEYKMKKYYFCSAGCKAAFDSEPEKYVTIHNVGLDSERENEM